MELGRAYAKLGRKQEALQELEEAIRLPVEDINAHLQKIDADELLVATFQKHLCTIQILVCH